jgi:hypothetical protein
MLAWTGGSRRKIKEVRRTRNLVQSVDSAGRLLLVSLYFAVWSPLRMDLADARSVRNKNGYPESALVIVYSGLTWERFAKQRYLSLQTKQSVQGRQRHFFEQRKLQNRSDASGSGRAGAEAPTFPAKKRPGGSLDIFSLTSLFIASKTNKRADVEEQTPKDGDSPLPDSSLRLGQTQNVPSNLAVRTSITASGGSKRSRDLPKFLEQDPDGLSGENLSDF